MTEASEFGDIEAGADNVDGLPVLRADAVNQSEEVRTLITHLNRPGDHRRAFQYAGSAVVVVTDRSMVLRRVKGRTKGDEIVRSIPKRANNGLLQQCVEKTVRWAKGQDATACRMPKWATDMIVDTSGNGLKPLSGVADFPVVAPGGRLMVGRDGYDEETGLFIDCEPVPYDNHPFPDARAAFKYLIEDWLGEFHFATPQDAARALTIPLTILNRRTQIVGGCPIPFITAPIRETGKTALAQVLVEVVTGSYLPASSWDHDSEQERRKMLLAVGLENPAAVLFDNINNGWGIKDATVDRWCTSDRISDRILGRSENVSVPSTALLMFTGNNIAPASADLLSRSYEVRMELPAKRKAFARKDIMGWTLENRAKIFSALMTILKADGRKTQHYNPTSRFPSWADIVGEKLQYAADDKTLFPRWSGTGYEDVNEDLEDLLKAMTAPAYQKANSVGFTAGEMSKNFSEHMARLDPKGTEEWMYDRSRTLIAHAVVPPKAIPRLLKRYNGHMGEKYRFRVDVGVHPSRTNREVNLFKAVADREEE